MARIEAQRVFKRATYFIISYFGTVLSIYTQMIEMIKLRLLGLPVLILSLSMSLNAQKKVFEGTLVYDIVIETGTNEPNISQASGNAITTVYIRDGQSRTDMVNSMGNESTIYDDKAGNGVILKEYSGQKLMITLSRQNWEAKNRNNSEIVFVSSKETKDIAGYTCRKALATLKNGKTFTVYYAPDLVPSTRDYNPVFRNLAGVAMEYEVDNGRMKFKYKLAKVSLEQVPSSKFDIPKSGYRIQTYEENQQLKKGE